MIGTQTYVSEYAWNADNLLVRKTYPSGRIVDYVRNTRGQVTAVGTRANAGAPAVTIASAIAYEPFGPVRALTHGNGVTVDLAYDLNGRLSAMDAFDGATPVMDLDYTYDLAGNITDIDDADTVGGSRGRDYAYDALHRLTQGKELAPGGSPVTLQTDYTYDAVGNRTTRTVGGAGETYTYDPASNRLASVLAGGVTRAFTYSASGNVTLDDAGGSATTLTYNALDRLVQVSAGGIPLVDYAYAATGQRAIKATPTATTHYLYDPGGALYAETDGAGTVLREYITLGGATIAIVDAGGVNYVHNDHLATPQVMTDGAAAVVWDASYRPFGEATIAGAAANQQRFPGQTADAETGYSDNWYRTYDASLGRYLQSDPIGLMAGLNTYAYAGGNPVMNMDPTGQILPFIAAIAWAIGEAGVLQVIVTVWAIYEVVQIAKRVTERYRNGCRGWDLITRWEITEIVLMGKLKWLKFVWRPFKGSRGAPGFAMSGGGGVPGVPTRPRGPGGPGGGGGKGPGGPGGTKGPGDDGPLLPDDYWKKKKAPFQREPGSGDITSQKPSSKSDEVYTKTEHYDEYGRLEGITDYTSHNDPLAHPWNPHHHPRNPATGEWIKNPDTGRNIWPGKYR